MISTFRGYLTSIVCLELLQQKAILPRTQDILVAVKNLFLSLTSMGMAGRANLLRPLIADLEGLRDRGGVTVDLPRYDRLYRFLETTGVYPEGGEDSIVFAAQLLDELTRSQIIDPLGPMATFWRGTDQAGSVPLVDQTSGLMWIQTLDPQASLVSTRVVPSNYLLGKRIYAPKERISTVYAAIEVGPNRPVAIKISQPTDAVSYGMARQEQNVLQRIHSPHIVNYLGHGLTASGIPFLVLEYFPGGTVEDVITTRKHGMVPFSWDAALEIGRQMVEAVVAVHDKGFIHRDIKPKNLLRSAQGVVKLIDFGLAVRSTRTSKEDRWLHLTQRWGTPGYQAPEAQWKGFNIDQRYDIFSLGRVLDNLLDSLLGSGNRSRPELVLELRRIIAQATARFPRDRYPTARDLLQDVRRLA